MQINVSIDSSPPRLVGRDEEIILVHRRGRPSAPENEAGLLERCDSGESYFVMSGLGPCASLQRDCNNHLGCSATSDVCNPCWIFKAYLMMVNFASGQ